MRVREGQCSILHIRSLESWPSFFENNPSVLKFVGPDSFCPASGQLAVVNRNEVFTFQLTGGGNRLAVPGNPAEEPEAPEQERSVRVRIQEFAERLKPPHLPSGRLLEDIMDELGTEQAPGTVLEAQVVQRPHPAVGGVPQSFLLVGAEAAPYPADREATVFGSGNEPLQGGVCAERHAAFGHCPDAGSVLEENADVRLPAFRCGGDPSVERVVNADKYQVAVFQA